MNTDLGGFDLGRLDTLAAGNSWVHALDPRTKLVATLLFIVTVVSFNKYAVSELLPFFIFPVILAAAGDVPQGYVWRRAALAAPFVLLLGLFNPWLDPQPRALFGAVQIAGGWISWLSILLRALLTTGAALTLIAVTGLPALCAALDRSGVPRVFVVQLLFLYRYLFVLIEEASNMLLARSLRSAGRGTGLRSYGPLVGHLLLRTFDRARRIHLAMLCRGFTGEFHLLRPLRLRATDALFLVAWAAFFLLLRVGDGPRRLGELVLGWFA